MSTFMHQELQEHPTEVGLGGAWAGYFNEDATDFGQRLMVVLPDFNPQMAFGPCRWQARDDTSLPAKGDTCLVLFADDGDPWVIAWWPFAT